ncbi:MAG: 3-deoxy-D-manno-octulosonic acid transferase [Planctomycetaceae bacterium]|nr:3-deoxy-D-manno-octulosonic acid transferase [Planctomycetaceae bacterium]
MPGSNERPGDCADSPKDGFVFGWILNVCYLTILLVMSPVLLWKRWRWGKYRRGWPEKFLGSVPKLPVPTRDRIWLHAVSVGEVLQLPQVVDRLRLKRPDVEFVISTTTETGYDVATKQFPENLVVFFPLDLTWSVSRAIERIQPTLVVLVELEIWPNFVLTVRDRRIPLALINGRMSEKSFRGYRLIPKLCDRLFRCFDLVAVQNDEYGHRFEELGCSSEAVTVTGSIKFDGVQADRDNFQTTDLGKFFRIQEGEVVFIAGSTQEPEEEFALSVYVELQATFPQLRFVLVPRHPERASEVAALVRRFGCPLISRTGRHDHHAGTGSAVGLLDTVGELNACWGLAEIAFVGGSFTDRGGQNMMEPAAYGAAVCFGPNVWNFRQVVDLMLAKDAARIVATKHELKDFVAEMLTSQEIRQQLGKRAQHLVQSQQGATDRTVSLLCSLLDPRNSKNSQIASSVRIETLPTE